MVNEVNKLILNTLVEQGAVYIPNIGTLSIYRTASRKRGSKISAPSYSVTFTTERKATSLSSEIMGIANVDKIAADDIVERWHKKLSKDGRVVIEGVGTIANGYFSPDSDLIAKLNAHNETIRLSGNASSGKRLWLIPLIIVAFIALGLNLYLIFTDREPSNQETTTEPVEPAAEVADTTEITTAVDEAPIVEEAAPAEVETTPAPQIEEQQPEQTPAEITDWRQLGARHYVIYGSYSNTTNANNAIRKILRRNPAAQCQIIRIGSLHGVAVYGSYNRNDCAIFKRQHRSLYKDAWIYTPRR